jgi:hypothetical protein
VQNKVQKWKSLSELEYQKVVRTLLSPSQHKLPPTLAADQPEVQQPQSIPIIRERKEIPSIAITSAPMMATSSNVRRLLADKDTGTYA